MLHNVREFNKSSSGTELVIEGSGSGGSTGAGGEEGEEESFLGLGWGKVEWAVMLLGIGTIVAAMSWMVRYLTQSVCHSGPDQDKPGDFSVKTGSGG